MAAAKLLDREMAHVGCSFLAPSQSILNKEDVCDYDYVMGELKRVRFEVI